MTLWREYKNKLVSPAQAVTLVQSGDWVDYNFGLASPVALDAALAARQDELFDVKIRGAMRFTPLAVVEADASRDHFSYQSWHHGAYERRLYDRGLCSYIPMIYRHMPLYYRKSLEVDVSLCAVSPMDDRGWFNLSLTNSAGRAICETAKKVVLEVNENLPIIRGGGENAIHLDEVDYVVEGGNPRLPSLAPAPYGEMERKIAGHIIERIRDGAVIQLGVGALPNAVGAVLAESDLKDLGMHTEMMVDAYRDLHRAGKITNRRKKIDPGRSVFSFCFGSDELYDWVRGYADLVDSRPIDYVNDPAVIAAHDHMITINNCLEVDLRGQVTSETAGHRHISGTGGQLDFVTGGYQSPHGYSFVCFTSTFTDKKSGAVQSRVVADLAPGTVVTNPRSQVHCLVTEWGLADLAGRSTWERAERIINIAHPDFRDDLIRQAQAFGLWRRSNKIA